MKYFWTMILAVALAGTVSAAPKKTKAAAKEPAKPALETKLNASLALTDGNSETLAENVSLVMEGEKEGLGSVLASIENNYGVGAGRQCHPRSSVPVGIGHTALARRAVGSPRPIGPPCGVTKPDRSRRCASGVVPVVGLQQRQYPWLIERESAGLGGPIADTSDIADGLDGRRWCSGNWSDRR